MFNFKGQNIVVIGGSGYLGLEISKSFLKYGANLIVVGRTSSKLDKIINYAQKGKFRNLKTLQLDVSSLSDIKQLNKSISKKKNTLSSKFGIYR